MGITLHHIHTFTKWVLLCTTFITLQNMYYSAPNLYLNNWVLLCTTFIPSQNGYYSAPHSYLHNMGITLRHIHTCTKWVLLCTTFIPVQNGYYYVPHSYLYNWVLRCSAIIVVFLCQLCQLAQTL